MLIGFDDVHPYEKLLISANTRLWRKDLDLDPILNPLSDRLISLALELDGGFIPSFVEAGIIWRTCRIPISEESSLFLSNYWDLLQASAAFSLIALNTPVRQAVDFAVNFCDLLSVTYEDRQLSSRVGLSEIIDMAHSELLELGSNLEPTLEKYGSKLVAIKVSVDLLNVHTKFQENYDCSSSYKMGHQSGLSIGDSCSLKWSGFFGQVCGSAKMHPG